MQPDVQNHGYAIGVAAAMIAQAGCPTRSLDLKALQKHLIEAGNLPKSVLTDQDSYPMPAEKIAAAVLSLASDYKGASAVLANPEQALPLLRKAYADAADAKVKLIYAHTLAMMGDATGLPTLLDVVNAAQGFDQGWDYVGMGQFGASMSRLDTYLLALGQAGDRRATPAVVAKLKLLTPQTAFSHFRAVARALSLLHDPAAAAPIAEVLNQPGIRGKAIPSVAVAKERDAASAGGTNAVGTRRESLRELFLAAALYQCGDHGGLGEQILKEYAQDLRGHLARYATAVLQAGKRP
jgi:hypothetical protein